LILKKNYDFINPVRNCDDFYVVGLALAFQYKKFANA